jgi:serine phosphatase RsbU (regulator of sigma subunit)
LLLGGPDPNATYQEAATPLPPTGSLLAFSDGVTEAGAHSGLPQFQHARLPALLGGLPVGMKAVEVMTALMTTLQGHVGANWPEDDTTACCLRRD